MIEEENKLRDQEASRNTVCLSYQLVRSAAINKNEATLHFRIELIHWPRLHACNTERIFDSNFRRCSLLSRGAERHCVTKLNTHGKSSDSSSFDNLTGSLLSRVHILSNTNKITKTP